MASNAPASKKNHVPPALATPTDLAAKGVAAISAELRACWQTCSRCM